MTKRREAAAIQELVEALKSVPIPGCHEPMPQFYERMNDWLSSDYRAALAKYGVGNNIEGI